MEVQDKPYFDKTFEIYMHLQNWLSQSARLPSPYSKFSVCDISEVKPLDLLASSDSTIDYLGQLLLNAHGNLDMLGDVYRLLTEDAHEIG